MMKIPWLAGKKPHLGNGKESSIPFKWNFFFLLNISSSYHDKLTIECVDS